MPEPAATPQRRPPVIGLAGAIGAGKSTVASILAAAGCLVSDADRLARDILADPAVVAELVSWWGKGVTDAEGRRAAAERTMSRASDRAARRRMEAFINPWVHGARSGAFDAAPPGTPALVVDAPLLFEAGLAQECDAVIFVDADRATRVERVANRGWAADELDRREAAQWPLDRKRASADHVVRNDADLASLRTQVLERLGRIVSDRDERPNDSV